MSVVAGSPVSRPPRTAWPLFSQATRVLERAVASGRWQGGELGRHVDRQTRVLRVLIIANGGGYPPWQLRSAIIRACIKPGSAAKG
jgi:hypothetical protein